MVTLILIPFCGKYKKKVYILLVFFFFIIEFASSINRKRRKIWQVMTIQGTPMHRY